MRLRKFPARHTRAATARAGLTIKATSRPCRKPLRTPSPAPTLTSRAPHGPKKPEDTASTRSAASASPRRGHRLTARRPGPAHATRLWWSRSEWAVACLFPWRLAMRSVNGLSLPSSKSSGSIDARSPCRCRAWRVGTKRACQAEASTLARPGGRCPQHRFR
jgi:hypothetical protein